MPLDPDGTFETYSWLLSQITRKEESMPRRTENETLTDKKRKMVVEEMIAENLLKKTPLAECWRLTHPDSEANDNSARVMAQREIARYLRRYPQGYERLCRRLSKAIRKKNNAEFMSLVAS